MPTPPESQARCSRRFFVAFASCLVAAAAVFASAAAAYDTCPRAIRAAVTAATGLPHTGMPPNDTSPCDLLLWSGHKPLPGKPSKAAEKAGRLALFTVGSQDLHEPYSEAHDNGFTNGLTPNRIYIEDFYMPFAINTFGAEAAMAGTGPSSFGKSSRPPFQVIGLWWSFSESARLQIYLSQYHKSRLQLEHELAAIAARTVPAIGL